MILKIQLSSLILSLSVIPFAFYKMEGIFIGDLNDNFNHENMINIFAPVLLN